MTHPELKPYNSVRSVPSLHQERNFFWEARNRILSWYVGLMIALIGLSIPIFTELSFWRVSERVKDDLAEELESFENFLEDRETTRSPFSPNDIDRVFTDFLSQRIPEDDTFLITIIDENRYYSSPRALPNVLQPGSVLIEQWKTLKEEKEGVQPSLEPALGDLIYLAQPVTIDGKQQGVFIAVHTSAGEVREVIEVITIVIEVLLIGLGLAVILAWLASGKVLSPLRSLAQAARSINDTDLTQRIPIRGTGEIAELALTFNSMMERLQNAFESQRAFLNDVGHELRTPITIIRGHLELMDDDPQEQQSTLELVIDELDRMNRFIDELLVLAKAERPDFLTLETVNLSTYTQELYNKARGLAPRQWQIECSSDRQIRLDRQRITQAIMNLAENATHHTQESDTITIGSQIVGRYVRFWVEDTGEGIALQDQEKIFERFFRSRRRTRIGHGLGLSIVKAIAQAHKGRVELISEVGVGSTFTLVLQLD